MRLRAAAIGLRVLGLRGATPYDGGVPIFVDGKIIGAVGVSGVLPAQDGQIANGGASALK
jgi:glc operon protein GlcG